MTCNPIVFIPVSWLSLSQAIYKARRFKDPEEKAKLSAKEVLSVFDENNDGFVTEDEFLRETDKCESLKELLQGF